LAAVAALLAGSDAAPADAADATHRALVVGNGGYEQLAQPEQCPTSAKYLADALRELQFKVDEIIDGTNGRISAGIFRLAQPAAPDSLTIVYFCGYGVMFEERAFLIPVRADLDGPFRVLTEGILAKSIYAALERSGGGQALVVLDVVEPGAEGAQAAFVPPVPPEDVVALVSTGVAPSFPGLTGLRLSQDLAKPGAELGTVLTAIFEEPAGDAGRSIDLSGLPDQPVVLSAAAPAPAPAAAVATPAPDTQEETQPATAAEPASAPSPPPAAEEEAPPADEPGFALSLSEVDRRSIQEELRRLGFYSGGIDGDFGPGTRAAVARYQQDLGEAATGRLTPAQVMRLLAGAGQ
jgi:hypothetical protein